MPCSTSTQVRGINFGMRMRTKKGWRLSWHGFKSLHGAHSAPSFRQLISLRLMVTVLAEAKDEQTRLVSPPRSIHQNLLCKRTTVLRISSSMPSCRADGEALSREPLTLCEFEAIECVCATIFAERENWVTSFRSFFHFQQTEVIPKI